SAIWKPMADEWIDQFAEHLGTDANASRSTVRNYTRALGKFLDWLRREKGLSPAWRKLQRDDFRSYLLHLVHDELGCGSIQLRFSALKAFYKFLVLRGRVKSSPITNLAVVAEVWIDLFEEHLRAAGAS